MANTLSLANITGVATPPPPAPPVAGIDRNAVRTYEREKLIRYSVALTGSYVVAVRGTNTGEVIDLTKSPANANFSPMELWGYKGPVRGYVISPGFAGYAMSIVPGADALHWLLVIFSTLTAQLAAGAYPGALTADADIVLEFSGQIFD